VHCGNTELQVTKNCHSALQHLRKWLDYFITWVDAICINQKDSDENGEKTWQVTLIGDLYSNADPVYEWLGEATPATNMAMSYLSDNVFEGYFNKSAPGAAAWSIL
jgi:hypothetical protein